ncbi:hypothetical protein [Paraburkholderia diazotrophica]|uniref:Uncharacterized protein n=1 Tax=Paraburkholderia diazotrophica TaxID=667676 RepID=A0A1H7CMA0_9BURK|nr:hypothetical protein [Paraburkholderia diazotrophica]SEJ90893.1 hypothetical protein SAMN05192539_102311 [Paraburkholderia diazotrophica]
MESSTRPRKRKKAPACPPIGALMRYGERTVRVIAEASGQRVIIESVDEEGRTFRSAVKWISLTALHDQLF